MKRLLIVSSLFLTISCFGQGNPVVTINSITNLIKRVFSSQGQFDTNNLTITNVGSAGLPSGIVTNGGTASLTDVTLSGTLLGSGASFTTINANTVTGGTIDVNNLTTTHNFTSSNYVSTGAGYFQGDLNLPNRTLTLSTGTNCEVKLGTNVIVQLSSSGNVFITGFSTIPTGDRLRIIKYLAPWTNMWIHEDAVATNVNRLHNDLLTTTISNVGPATTIWHYDTLDSRWHLVLFYNGTLGTNSGGGGVASQFYADLQGAPTDSSGLAAYLARMVTNFQQSATLTGAFSGVLSGDAVQVTNIVHATNYDGNGWTYGVDFRNMTNQMLLTGDVTNFTSIRRFGFDRAVSTAINTMEVFRYAIITNGAWETLPTPEPASPTGYTNRGGCYLIVTNQTPIQAMEMEITWTTNRMNDSNPNYLELPVIGIFEDATFSGTNTVLTGIAFHVYFDRTSVSYGFLENFNTFAVYDNEVSSGRPGVIAYTFATDQYPKPGDTVKFGLYRTGPKTVVLRVGSVSIPMYQDYFTNFFTKANYAWFETAPNDSTHFNTRAQVKAMRWDTSMKTFEGGMSEELVYTNRNTNSSLTIDRNSMQKVGKRFHGPIEVNETPWLTNNLLMAKTNIVFNGFQLFTYATNRVFSGGFFFTNNGANAWLRTDGSAAQWLTNDGNNYYFRITSAFRTNTLYTNSIFGLYGSQNTVVSPTTNRFNKITTPELIADSLIAGNTTNSGTMTLGTYPTNRPDVATKGYVDDTRTNSTTVITTNIISVVWDITRNTNGSITNILWRRFANPVNDALTDTNLETGAWAELRTNATVGYMPTGAHEHILLANLQYALSTNLSFGTNYPGINVSGDANVNNLRVTNDFTIATAIITNTYEIRETLAYTGTNVILDLRRAGGFLDLSGNAHIMATNIINNPVTNSCYRLVTYQSSGGAFTTWDSLRFFRQGSTPLGLSTNQGSFNVFWIESLYGTNYLVLDIPNITRSTQ